jgi:hypothetical protein
LDSFTGTGTTRTFLRLFTIAPHPDLTIGNILAAYVGSDSDVNG